MVSLKRIKKSLDRIFLFYGNALKYRRIYKFSFLKYLLFIPVKFFFTLFFGVAAGKRAVKRFKLMDSYIIDKKGKKFHAINVIYFFEQFIHKIYDTDPDFKIKKGRLVVDCGAAAGEYTLLALEKGAKVFAIEAEDRAFSYLKENVSSYKNVRLEHKAVSDKDTKTTIKLDTLLKKAERIDILKIDVEGHELHVLDGAKQTLKKTEKIIMELHTDFLEKKCKSILSKNFNLKIIKEKEDSQPLLFATKKKND